MANLASRGKRNSRLREMLSGIVASRTSSKSPAVSGRFELKVNGLQPGKYMLQENGADIGSTTDAEWAAGVDLWPMD